MRDAPRDEVLIECPVCFAQALTVPPYETWPLASDLLLVEPPYEDALGRPPYEVCPSCGFEFGNDDNPVTAPTTPFAEYRREWINDGRPLFADGLHASWRHMPTSLRILSDDHRTHQPRARIAGRCPD